MALPPQLQLSLIWPIQAKGAVVRQNPFGDPEVEQFYHKSLEEGRKLEASIGDANHWLIERRREVLARITAYLDLNKVAVNAQNKRRIRRILLAANSIHFLQQVNKFEQEISRLTKALTRNIGILQTIEQGVFRTAQANLNAVSNLLHDICNWGLPNIPAIPNFFSDTIWNWNGFNFFPLAAFIPQVGFDKNFAFNQCVIHIPSIDIFRNYPSTVQTYSGLTFGSPIFVPPLGGIIVNTQQNLSDPNFIKAMQSATTAPYYGPTFNQNSSMLGSVPDPSTIISNYHMPAATYQANIVSIVPATRGDTVEPTDADYKNPNISVRNPKLRADLVHFVTLQQIVASKFDPNLTAEWLFYLDLTRTGRGGAWIKNFQAVYDQFLAPSINDLKTISVPWNNVLGGPGVSNSPSDIKLLDALKSATPTAQLNLLWKLSYIEAALLGYTRTKDWDAGADGVYLSDFTGTDLDYQSTKIDPTVTTTVTLGTGTAQFPVQCTFPSAIAAILNQVIAKATVDIANTPGFQSAHPQFRFTFDSFAVATPVDRFTQFWREFNNNLQILLVQDPFLVSFAVSYVASLDSAVNPLGDPTDYALIRTDATSRNRTWVPGTPLLPLPIAPVVAFSSSQLPTDANNGWQGLDLNPVAFLSRPDIQGQPIPVQNAMLRTNLSFAAISKSRDAQITEIQNQIATAQAALAVNNIGFLVEISANTPQVIPTGAAGAALSFDLTDFDITHNVTSQNTFTIQAQGSYTISGEVDWDTGPVGIRTVTVFQNSNPIFSQSTDSVVGPVALQFSSLGQFSNGDVIQVVATHSLGTTQNVVGGNFSMIQFQQDGTAGGLQSDNSSNAKTFTAAGNFPAGTVVRVDSTGRVTPVDPTVVLDDSTGLPFSTPPGPVTGVRFPFADGITLGAAVTGNQVSVGTNYGGVYQILGSSLTVGGLVYVSPTGAITQNYGTLITNVQWVICIGRAIATDTILWEPNIPQRFNMAF